MKIHANGFYVDMNAMLNQINGQNGLQNADAVYKKAMADVEPKIKQANANLKQATTDFNNLVTATSSKNIQYVDDQNKKVRQNIKQAHDDLSNFFNNKNYETVNQINSDYNKLWGHLVINGQKINDSQDMINAVMADDRKASQALGEKINAANQFTQEVIDTDMPQYVQKQMQAVRDSFPTNQVMYYPPGQLPPTATAGDICWQSGNYNGQEINAQAFRYDGTEWKPVRTTLDLFASNIYSPNITGGTIKGSQFVSQYHGIDGVSNFYVNEKGDIYARNFSMDLMHNNTGSEVNNITYDTEGDSSKGLNFNDGMLHMSSYAFQNTGTLIKDYQGQYNAYTYIEPDYLKLRSVTGGGQLFGRTDIRGGNLEISDNWDQNTGVRAGYWDTGAGGEGPDVIVGSLNKNGAFSAIGSTGIVTTDINATGQIMGGSIYENGLRVLTSKDKRKPFDPSGLQNQINANGGTLKKHGIRLDGHDGKFRSDESTLNVHNNRLNQDDVTLSQHQQWMYQHDDLFNKRGIKLDKFTKELKNDGDILTNQGVLIGANGNQITQQGYRLDSHGDLLNQHGQKLSTHDQEFIDKQSQLDDHQNTLTTHQQEIDQINTNTNNIQNQANEWSSFINQVNTYYAGGGLQICGISIYGNRIYGNTDSEQVLFHNYYGQTVDIRAGDIYSQGNKIASDRSLKKDIAAVDSKDALSKVLNTDIKSWRYKSDKETCQKRIGPIIDDYNSDSNQKYYTPDDLVKRTKDGDAFSLNSAISFLFLSVQELQKQNSQLSQRLAKIEFNNKFNNK